MRSGCELCPPGAAHSDSELPADIELSTAATCLGCHDGENDPDFDFAKKWPLIEH